MTNVTLSGIKKFARDPKNWKLATEYLALKVKAEATQKAMDEIYNPIFQRYSFQDDEGNPITNKDDLYLCIDDENFEKFYAECDHAVRIIHGWDVKEGYCPALIAEHEVIQKQNEILEVTSNWMGIQCPIVMEDRKQMLDLFLGLTSKAMHEQA